MKRLLTTTFCLTLLAFSAQTVLAENTTPVQKTNTSTNRMSSPNGQFEKRKHPIMNLEEELKLNDSQKAQAKANRIKTRKEMKPIMDEIRTKKEAILDIIDSDLTQEEQQKKIKPIRDEIKALYKKANALREKNMKEFEKILTRTQKSKFEQLKRKHPIGGCKYCKRKVPMPPMPPEEE